MVKFIFYLAESEGFEPPDLLQSTVFKTAAIDHSAISPKKTKIFVFQWCKYRTFLNSDKIIFLDFSTFFITH